jgi:hypothetical protein
VLLGNSQRRFISYLTGSIHQMLQLSRSRAHSVELSNEIWNTSLKDVRPGTASDQHDHPGLPVGIALMKPWKEHSDSGGKTHDLVSSMCPSRFDAAWRLTPRTWAI